MFSVCRCFILLVFLTFLGSCVSARFDRDFYNETYHRGKHTPASALVENGPGGQETAAVAAGIGAATLAANPDYYKKTTITGRCVFATGKHLAFDVPCHNTTIVLTDADGEEVARVAVNGGRFAIPLDVDRAYTLDVVANRFSLKAPRNVRMGDTLYLRLVEKPKFSNS